ncbi:hypothetical protein FHG87_013709 [Trinorchestia longiramus]|nr:hypothetical protein FHG87_013709 [Trinorchestia longiramus]
MIYEARVKDERQKVENLRNKGPDGIKEWYNFIQGNNRNNEVQIHELVVDGCKVSDHGQMVKAVVDFWDGRGLHTGPATLRQHLLVFVSGTRGFGHTSIASALWKIPITLVVLKKPSTIFFSLALTTLQNVPP